MLPWEGFYCFEPQALYYLKKKNLSAASWMLWQHYKSSTTQGGSGFASSLPSVRTEECWTSRDKRDYTTQLPSPTAWASFFWNTQVCTLQCRFKGRVQASKPGKSSALSKGDTFREFNLIWLRSESSYFTQ